MARSRGICTAAARNRRPNALAKCVAAVAPREALLVGLADLPVALRPVVLAALRALPPLVVLAALLRVGSVVPQVRHLVLLLRRWK